MPTNNPRLTLALPPELARVLKRLSELTDNSQSALIVDLLQQSRPVFDRLIAVLEAAEAAREHLRTEMASNLEAAQSAIEQQLGLALGAMD